MWCGWNYDEKNNVIVWDGREKFYNYVNWISYIIKNILNDRYLLNGVIKWEGQFQEDKGVIIICDNKIKSTNPKNLPNCTRAYKYDHRNIARNQKLILFYKK